MNRSPDIERVEVRLARDEDAASIARIYNHYVGAGGSSFDDQHWTADQTSKRLAAPYPEGWFVAADDRDLWGWASVRRYSARFGYRFTCESAIYLDAAALGSGVVPRPGHFRARLRCNRCCLGMSAGRYLAGRHRWLQDSGAALLWRHGTV